MSRNGIILARSIVVIFRVGGGEMGGDGVHIFTRLRKGDAGLEPADAMNPQARSPELQRLRGPLPNGQVNVLRKESAKSEIERGGTTPMIV